MPAEDGRAGDAALDIIVEPPAIGEAKRQCQELCLGGQLIGDEQAALAQQRLAVLQRVAHVARGVQHVRRKQHVVGSQLVPLYHCAQRMVMAAWRTLNSCRACARQHEGAHTITPVLYNADV